jgi:hypothetical protein
VHLVKVVRDWIDLFGPNNRLFSLFVGGWLVLIYLERKVLLTGC